jgi:NADH-quinone oxidoreductase subunit E
MAAESGCCGEAPLLSAEEEQVVAVLQRHPRDHEYLIPILQDVQEIIGYLPTTAMVQVGRYLDLRPTAVYGAATFYNQFRLEPVGRHVIHLCRGTACHVRGSARLLQALETELGVKAGRTTRDGTFTLNTVACLGCCGLAPVLMIDEQAYGRLTNRQIPKILAAYK